MDIGTPLRDLGEINAQPLIDKILSLDEESWNCLLYTSDAADE